MADGKKDVDVAMLFGPPGGGGSSGGGMGPDDVFKDNARAVLDDKAPMASRVDALYELIHACISESKGSGDAEPDKDDTGEY